MKTKIVGTTMIGLLIVIILIPGINATENTSPSDDLEMTLTTDKNVYHWIFEPVRITFTLKNLGDEDKTITFPTTQRYDFTIKTWFGWKIFHWVDGKVFAQLITNITIPAGGTISWNVTWRQKGHLLPWIFYRPVLPGIYYITGQIPTEDKIYEENVGIRVARVATF